MDKLLYELVDSMAREPGTRQALAGAREQGWKMAIVPNGTTTQQSLKIQKLGLEPCVDAVVISEAEGVKKPDPEIFRLAARRLGLEVNGGWLLGDHPVAGIADGRAVGLETGWVSRGMKWPEREPSSTVTAGTAAEVIGTVVRQCPC
ncbi:hypothetical protein ART_2899 [Arthrobacter sp. PAMC 25486]|nr:hypothetical protein ART_2899 [Arthrobacter sp. PAMC 25486]